MWQSLLPHRLLRIKRQSRDILFYLTWDGRLSPLHSACTAPVQSPVQPGHALHYARCKVSRTLASSGIRDKRIALIKVNSTEIKILILWIQNVLGVESLYVYWLPDNAVQWRMWSSIVKKATKSENTLSLLQLLC